MQIVTLLDIHYQAARSVPGTLYSIALQLSQERMDHSSGTAAKPVRCLCRTLRLVMFGFFAVSASIGGVIALSQLTAALAHAPGALPLEQVAEVCTA